MKILQGCSLEVALCETDLCVVREKKKKKIHLSVQNIVFDPSPTSEISTLGRKPEPCLGPVWEGLSKGILDRFFVAIAISCGGPNKVLGD
jgi:hypothetical protein